ncbi:hypothetical protein ACXR0O_24410 [Verrucomicrobiota bacterium sgz303538]
MKKYLLSLLSLGLVATAPFANAARLSVDLDRDLEIRHGHRMHSDRDFRTDRDFRGPARVVSETKRTIIEPDGDRVVVTRRVFQEPDGDRFVRETRRIIDRD